MLPTHLASRIGGLGAPPVEVIQNNLQVCEPTKVEQPIYYMSVG
jgi:hypothetical protein